MPIDTGVPSSTRQPGSFVKFDVTTAARGLVSLTRYGALIGMKTASGTKAVATPVLVSSADEADTYFGRNSELALMCRAALAEGRRAGRCPEIWAVAVAPPAGVAATFTFTITGPATAAGDLIIKIAGRVIRAAVANGDAQNTIAAALKNAIDTQAATGDLPVTAGVATNVVTVTFPHIGVNGNDVRVSTESTPTGVACTAAAGVTGTGSYDITASLDVLIDKTYRGVAVANHLAADVTDLATYQTARALPGAKAWSYSFMGETGTLATATSLASGANSEYQVIANYEQGPAMPGEVAARLMVARLAKEQPNLPLSGYELDLPLPPDAYVYTPSEIESALSAGVTPLTPNATKSKMKVERLVTTRTTLNSAPFDALRDLAVHYALSYMGEQYDAAIRVMMSADENKLVDAETKKRIRSKLIEVARAGEEARIVQNVDAHIGEFVVETDATVKSRVNYDTPNSVVPGLEQVAGVMRLFLE